jgi:CheY-like chemotaxis protein
VAISLYKRPGIISFLDDDADFLELLGEVMPADWSLRLFDEPTSLMESMQADNQVFADETWQHQSILEKTKGGESAIAQVLQYWRSDGIQRYSTTRVFVVDYSMPALTGLEVLERLEQWPGARLLLTGQADEMLAVTAFNKGLIHQFIPKQTKDLARRLIETIQSLMELPLGDLGKIWLNNLTREQLGLVRDPAVAHWLVSLVKAQGWVEYAVIGAPFGILGLTADGMVGWLQIEHHESARSLDELAEVVNTLDLSPAQIQGVKEGQLVVDFELQLALRSEGALRTAPALHLPGTEMVSAAVFPIDARFAPGSSCSWNQHLKGRARDRYTV